MAIYHINNFLILVWALLFCFKNPSKKKNLIFIIISFTQLFLISILRYNIGHDYQMYLEGFIKMGMDGFSNLKYLDWELGFNLYTKIIVFFTRSEKIYFGVTALICLLPPAWFIYKNSKNVWLSTLIYVNLSFFYCTMNFLRQSIAISIMLVSWHFLKKKKFIPFALLIILASTFHTTVLIMLPMYFLVKLKTGIKTVLLYCYGLLFFYISSDGFIDLLTDVFHSEYKNSVFISEGLPFFYSIIPILILIAVLILNKHLVELNKNNQILINMLYCATFWMVIMSKHSILERISYYPYIFVIILIPEIVEVFKIKLNKRFYNKEISKFKYKSLISGQEINDTIKTKLNVIAQRKVKLATFPLIFAILIILFLYNTFGMYVGENGIHGVFPYDTWII